MADGTVEGRSAHAAGRPAKASGHEDETGAQQDPLAGVWPPRPLTEGVQEPEDRPRVQTAVHAGVAYLVIDRPEKRNALDAATRDALIRMIAAYGASDVVHVIVLSGRGRIFAAGADLNEMLARSEAEQRAFISPPHIYDAIVSCPKPVIAALNGHALGAGCELAMACDMRTAVEDAKLGQPETTLGLIPGGGGTQRLARLVGAGRAMRMVLSGTLVDAVAAERLGLVEEYVAHDAFHDHVQRFAEGLAKQSPVALRAAKRAVQAAWEKPLAEGLATEIDLFMEVFRSADAKEGVAAFLEKRKPRFEGR